MKPMYTKLPQRIVCSLFIINLDLGNTIPRAHLHFKNCLGHDLNDNGRKLKLTEVTQVFYFSVFLKYWHYL